MLYADYTEELLGLKDAIVTKFENIEGCVHIYLDMKFETQVCPHCHHETKRVHDYRTQIVKDLANFGVPICLHLRKRRYYASTAIKALTKKLAFSQDIKELQLECEHISWISFERFAP